ncbi:MAG: tyrosine-type recombinase/integrase [Thermoleophilia bacterium]
MPQAKSSPRQPTGLPGWNANRTLPAEPLSPAEVQALMAAFNRGATGDRNRAFVAILYRGGLRISEALELRPADVNLAAGTIRVLHGKGDRARTVGIDDGGLRHVERWMAHRTRRGLNGHHRLLTKLDGTPWSPQAAREALYYAARKAGIEKRVHPHGLRHTHAAELSMERVPVATIQRQLGHSNLAVTSRYLDHIAPADVIAVGRGRTWQEDATD